MNKLIARTALLGLALTSLAACNMQQGGRMYGEDRYQYDKRFNCPQGHSYRGGCTDTDHFRADIYVNNDAVTYNTPPAPYDTRYDGRTEDGRVVDSNTRTIKNEKRKHRRY